MKARKLKSILNNTEYTIGDYEDYIAIGSPLCHDLISLNKKTFQIKYALDTFHKGKESLRNDELLFIWNKLEELVVSAEIVDIINGNDTIDNPLPVYYIEKGQLIKTYTDEYGWPNTTEDGKIMYNNVFFKTQEEAIQSELKEYTYILETLEERKEELSNELVKVSTKINQVKFWQLKFSTLTP